MNLYSMFNKKRKNKKSKFMKYICNFYKNFSFNRNAQFWFLLIYYIRWFAFKWIFCSSISKQTLSLSLPMCVCVSRSINAIAQCANDEDSWRDFLRQVWLFDANQWQHYPFHRTMPFRIFNHHFSGIFIHIFIEMELILCITNWMAFAEHETLPLGRIDV